MRNKIILNKFESDYFNHNLIDLFLLNEIKDKLN